MDLAKIDELLRNITFDGFYVEATFQFKLLMRLAKIFNEDSILPERNIGYYKLNPKHFSKKEVDIVKGKYTSRRGMRKMKLFTIYQGNILLHGTP